MTNYYEEFNIDPALKGDALIDAIRQKRREWMFKVSGAPTARLRSEAEQKVELLDEFKKIIQNESSPTGNNTREQDFARREQELKQRKQEEPVHIPANAVIGNSANGHTGAQETAVFYTGATSEWKKNGTKRGKRSLAGVLIVILFAFATVAVIAFLLSKGKNLNYNAGFVYESPIDSINRFFDIEDSRLYAELSADSVKTVKKLFDILDSGKARADVYFDSVKNDIKDREWSIEGLGTSLLEKLQGIKDSAYYDLELAYKTALMNYLDRYNVAKSNLVNKRKEVRENAIAEYVQSTAQQQKATATPAQVPESTFTDSRDGRTYRFVRIGQLTWMAENLNYQTGSSWCYDNDNFNCGKYGRLYNWNDAGRACPPGWHLPSRAEWNDLVQAAGGDAAGKKLKSRSSGYGTDDFGFSALLSGYRGAIYGTFDNIGLYGYWWTSTELGTSAYNGFMTPLNSNVIMDSNDKNNWLSVRCVQY